jgi:hypothetical protein
MMALELLDTKWWGKSADPAQAQQASRGPEDGSRSVGDCSLVR